MSKKKFYKVHKLDFNFEESKAQLQWYRKQMKSDFDLGDTVNVCYSDSNLAKLKGFFLKGIITHATVWTNGSSDRATYTIMKKDGNILMINTGHSYMPIMYTHRMVLIEKNNGRIFNRR